MPPQDLRHHRAPYANGPSISGTSWNTSRRHLGAASRECREPSCTSSAPTTRRRARSCSRRRARASARSSFIARLRRPAPLSAGFHLSFDHWHSTDSPENNPAVAGRIRAAQAAGLIYASRPTVLRSGEGHVPAGPLHQGECLTAIPRFSRRCLRGVQHGVRADRSHQPLFSAQRRAAGA